MNPRKKDDKNISNQSEDHISTIPAELLLGPLGKYLLSSAVISLSKTNRKHHHLFSENHENSHLGYKRGLGVLQRLLSHAALGEWEQAEIIYAEDSALLSMRGTIYHPNLSKDFIEIPFNQNPGRYQYVNRTAWQIALMNEEYEEAKKMGQFMTDEEKKSQYAEIFPDGELKKYNFDLETAKKLLRALWDEVAKDEIKIERDKSYNITMSHSTREALDKLYQYAKPTLEHEIGLVFDPQFYEEALKLYEKHHDQFNRKWDRYTFWNIRVEEWLAGCLGTRYLSVHSQGIGNPTSRTGCLLTDRSSYFAFRRPALNFPGFHFAVGFFGAVNECLEHEWGECRFQILCREIRQKRITYTEIFVPKIGMSS